MSKNTKEILIPEEVIASKIFTLRGQKVMLDSDLAELYEVETRRLNEQVKRNINRFPDDFMFQLNEKEWKILKSQNATSSWGGGRTMPFAFTEHGVLMLSSVLNSDRAIAVN
ncbi:MAG: ORF6N domain-containing protein, partial [Bacteroidia bacterium]